ncbi:MAG: hypothetical protein KJ574_01925, partial [Nanoarchaeota archaeon]|nr:hypothetical protein [Nanoarchaeota archaeon]
MNLESIVKFAQSLNYSEEDAERLYELLLVSFDLKRPPERPIASPFRKEGILITFDGHSGAGKDTQIDMLAKHIQEDRRYKGYQIIKLVQKRNDPFRQVSKYAWAHPEIAPDAKSSFLLLTAGRRYFVYNQILPLLEDPTNIILQNRSHLSHIAYHASSTERVWEMS